MLRNGAASLHGSTNVQKVCRIHEGRGHLSRRQLTARAFNARVHSSLYNEYGAWFGAFGRAATPPGGGPRSPWGEPAPIHKYICTYIYILNYIFYIYTRVDPCIKCTRSELATGEVDTAFVDLKSPFVSLLSRPAVGLVCSCPLLSFPLWPCPREAQGPLS